MARTGAVWMVAALIGVSVAAQPPEPRFDVASVKPVGTVTSGLRLQVGSPGIIPRALPGGVFSAAHATVTDLLWFAYDVRHDFIVGGPEWVREDRFEISARAESDAPADQIKLMVRSLLEERFSLVAHMEPREMRVQALIRARPDGPLGPSLLPIGECTPAVVNELRRTFPEKYPTPMGNGMMSGCSSTGVEMLAQYLTLQLGEPYVDATGLAGSFYHTLMSQLPAGPVRGSGAGRSDPNLPALQTALEEQLGLKVESRRGPVDVLVIDAVQQPTPN